MVNEFDEMKMKVLIIMGFISFIISNILYFDFYRDYKVGLYFMSSALMFLPIGIIIGKRDKQIKVKVK